MLRLIIKDFYMMLNALPAFGVIVAIAVVVNISKSSPIISFFPILLSFGMVGSIISIDDKYKLDSMYCSLPLKRSAVVYAKYVSTAIVILAGLALSFASGMFYPGHTLTVKGAFYVFSSFALFFSVLFPMNYRFGFQMEMEPGKIVAVVFLIVFTLAMIFTFTKLRGDHIVIYLSLFVVAFVFASIKLSVYFYKRRDF